MSQTENDVIKPPSRILHPLIYVCIAGAALRNWLMQSKYQQLIQNHIEVSTPLNSWKRVLEGIYLDSLNINPYEGDLLHETPTSLYFYKFVARGCVHPRIYFILADVFTAINLYFITRKYMFKVYCHEQRNKEDYAEGAEDIMLNGEDFRKSPLLVATMFLLNPFSLFCCVGLATTTFHNTLLSLCILIMVSGHSFLSSSLLAVVTSITFYPFVLILPLCLSFRQGKNTTVKIITSVFTFLLTLCLITYLCVCLDSSYKFFENVYGFILKAPDLTPNIGLFWYFFTEMFDHFRELFLCSYQMNATILYLVPMSIKLRKDIFILITTLLYITVIFKSYPSIGDTGFVYSLLPCYRHLFSYSQQAFLVSVMILICCTLGPIVWHLWIYSNSANANFYFGVTLAFAVANIFLLTDLLFSYIKRQFCLYNGKERNIDNQEADLVLD